MAAVAENWVILEPGVPKRIHMIDHIVEPREITDKYFGRPRTVTTWLFLVDREDGRPVDKTFSVLSGRLKAELSGYIPEKRYTRYEFTFIKDAPGTVPPRILEATPI